jgi:hypothetical protein
MILRIVCICVGALVLAPAEARRPRDDSHVSAFVTADECIACHSGLTTAVGEDVSIGYDWRATMMANSARDPYWQAAVRREVSDFPASAAAIEDTCATCHMPMARFDAAATSGRGEVFANLAPSAPSHGAAVDGVSCSVCHQIDPGNLGQAASFDGGFAIAPPGAAGARPSYGPYAIEPGRRAVMQSAASFVPTEGTHVQSSALCATCHTLFTAALDDEGRRIAELPEQVPYQEWLHSAFRETRSCQGCHMPEVAEQTPVAAVLGEPRARLSRHTFRGGNAFMLGILNKYRGELGVKALPQELDQAVRETRAYLATAAAGLAIDAPQRRGSTLEFDVVVTSTTGHKLPTAYPSRRVWLDVRVVDAAGAVLFESGAVRPDGSIAGNDNDEDPLRFEPHYTAIDSAAQVQIYESIMLDRNERVTTGLLSGVRYVKDNRLLPRGFDKDTADLAIAVHGGARDDADFVGGGDRVRYRVEVGRAGGALRVEAVLYYESIGFRWARNLDRYDAQETRRFGRYYAESAAGAAVQIASAAADVGAR